MWSNKHKLCHAVYVRGGGVLCGLLLGHEGHHTHEDDAVTIMWSDEPTESKACGETYAFWADAKCELDKGHEGQHSYHQFKYGEVGEKMEDDLKMCRNKRCGRKDILINAPNRKYCSACGAKLKNSWGHNLDPNVPPLLDPGPDEPPTNGKRGYMHQPTNGKVIQLGPPTETKLEMLTFSQFDGIWEKYQIYKEDFEKGLIKDNTPFMYERDLKRLAPRTSDTFTCAGDIKGCPVMKTRENDALIRIPHDMYRNWIWLALRFDTEWIAYLKGTQDAESKVWSITEMYFPRQKANGTHVDAADGEILEGTIGSVHSHVGMGAFFSTEDENHFNHEVEIVVNRKGELAMCVRMALECGRFTRLQCKALLIGNDTCQALATDLEAKMTEDRSSFQQSSRSSHSGYGSMS